MGFWDVEDDEPIKATGTYEKAGGDFDVIPKDTNVLAAPDEAKWSAHEGEDYISIRWTVLQPEAYKNRKIFHKLKVENSEAKKRDKDKRMLAAIDANAKGGLFESEGKPTDESLTKALVGKPMVLNLQVWDFKDKKGNWVAKVSPKGGDSKVTEPAAQKLDDEIPFD